MLFFFLFFLGLFVDEGDFRDFFVAVFLIVVGVVLCPPGGYTPHTEEG